MTRKDTLRFAALIAVLMAGSCAAPVNDGTVFSDPEANHPITTAPSYRSILLSFSVSAAGLTADDEARFESFVQAYSSRGNGAITISAPQGPGAADMFHYFGERLAQMGVERSRILVGTHDVVNDDARVELGYVTYVASTANCGDWSENVADTASNLPSPNFGCSVQQNIAAMVADPRDLVAPRGMDPADATRRTTVMGKYEKGDPTAATKTQDQSGAVADVNK